MRAWRTPGTPTSDYRSHSRGDDRNARADTDADADGKSDLTEAEAARGHAGEAERQRDDRADLAARAFEKRGEFVKRGVEGRIGAGERPPCKQHQRKARYRGPHRKTNATAPPPPGQHSRREQERQS